MKTMNMKQLILTILLCIFLTACASSVETEVGLDGTRWKLQYLEGSELLANTAILIKFSGNEMTGSAGCNAFGGKYATKSGGRFVIQEIARNMEACIEPEGIMEQEEHFIRLLGTVTSYRIVGEGLVFLDEAGKIVLQYEPVLEFNVNPDDLVGKTWQLTSMEGWETGNLGAFTLRFEANGLSGTTTCRDYAGKFQAAGDNLNITSLEMTTDLECGDAASGAEGGYTTLLENVQQYNVSPTKLELYTRRGEKLVFELVTDP